MYVRTVLNFTIGVTVTVRKTTTRWKKLISKLDSVHRIGCFNTKNHNKKLKYFASLRFRRWTHTSVWLRFLVNVRAVVCPKKKKHHDGSTHVMWQFRVWLNDLISYSFIPFGCGEIFQECETFITIRHEETHHETATGMTTGPDRISAAVVGRSV